MAGTGIFGGSFNPIHAAHVAVAERARAERALDRVLFVPALQPPHKTGEPLVAPHHRLRMVELAVADSPAFEACPLELEREGEGASYALLTVRRIREQIGGGTPLYLIVGGDMLSDIPDWWHAGELVREVDLIGVGRPGHPLEEGFERLAGAFGDCVAARARRLAVRVPPMDVSSTRIRELIRLGRSIQSLVPPAVGDYIRRHGLYAAG